jgi:hypothetical protein
MKKESTGVKHFSLSKMLRQTKLERFLLFSLFEDRETFKYKDIEYRGHTQTILASQGQTL